MVIHVTIPLTFTHLRFQARAGTPIRLGQYQGAERLRDALAQEKKNSRQIYSAAVEGQVYFMPVGHFTFKCIHASTSVGRLGALKEIPSAGLRLCFSSGSSWKWCGKVAANAK